MLAVKHSKTEGLATKRKFSPKEISKLAKNEIFVFGSNLEGMHAGGAARIANNKFGAEWGQGVGHWGQTYAIPTMHGELEAIKPYVDEFISYAKNHPNLTFLVTRIGCGIAGFKDEEVAPLFKDSLDLPNVQLPSSFVEILLSPLNMHGEVTPPWAEEWIKELPQDIPLNDQQFASLCKSFSPDWEFRYAPIQVGDWIYMGRSGFWVKKYKYEKLEDDLYHVTESYTTEKAICINILFGSFVRGYYKPKIFDREFLCEYQHSMPAYGLYVEREPEKCLCCGNEKLKIVPNGKSVEHISTLSHNWECPLCKTRYSDNI